MAVCEEAKKVDTIDYSKWKKSDFLTAISYKQGADISKELRVKASMKVVGLKKLFEQNYVGITSNNGNSKWTDADEEDLQRKKRGEIGTFEETGIYGRAITAQKEFVTSRLINLSYESRKEILVNVFQELIQEDRLYLLSTIASKALTEAEKGLLMTSLSDDNRAFEAQLGTTVSCDDGDDCNDNESISTLFEFVGNPVMVGNDRGQAGAVNTVAVESASRYDSFNNEDEPPLSSHNKNNGGYFFDSDEEEITAQQAIITNPTTQLVMASVESESEIDTDSGEDDSLHNTDSKYKKGSVSRFFHDDVSTDDESLNKEKRVSGFSLDNVSTNDEVKDGNELKERIVVDGEALLNLEQTEVPKQEALLNLEQTEVPRVESTNDNELEGGITVDLNAFKKKNDGVTLLKLELAARGIEFDKSCNKIGEIKNKFQKETGTKSKFKALSQQVVKAVEEGRIGK